MGEFGKFYCDTKHHKGISCYYIYRLIYEGKPVLIVDLTAHVFVDKYFVHL